MDVGSANCGHRHGDLWPAAYGTWLLRHRIPLENWNLYPRKACEVQQTALGHASRSWNLLRAGCNTSRPNISESAPSQQSDLDPQDLPNLQEGDPSISNASTSGAQGPPGVKTQVLDSKVLTVPVRDQSDSLPPSLYFFLAPHPLPPF